MTLLMFSTTPLTAVRDDKTSVMSLWNCPFRGHSIITPSLGLFILDKLKKNYRLNGKSQLSVSAGVCKAIQVILWKLMLKPSYFSSEMWARLPWFCLWSVKSFPWTFHPRLKRLPYQEIWHRNGFQLALSTIQVTFSQIFIFLILCFFHIGI